MHLLLLGVNTLGNRILPDGLPFALDGDNS
jgi:hypothetical protein